ncbi:MAG: M20/M25/M40 family metallo-hydrolase, partial [Longimicrobiales bacterium]|nr:M20/M25/M40 family metallo-hydrolase [Longimicrobiales bacterium]
MSDFDLPDLPSDEELGITDEDREKYADELPDDGPELSEEEMAALLGGSTAGLSPSGAPSSPASSKSAEGGPSRKEAKQKAKEEKKRAREAKKEAKRKAKEERRRAKAAAAARSTAAGSATTSPGPASTEDGGGAEAEASRAAGGSSEPPGSEPPGPAPASLAPMPAWRGPVTLLVLLGFSIFASARTGQVNPAPSNADPGEFSSARAMSIVEDMAREAHPPGSPEHQRVRDFLVERLTQLGLRPQVQTATSLIEGRASISDEAPMARAATVRNIVARIPGSNPSGSVLITAHYDSRGIAPGAGDDASGVAAILEALRALQTGPTLRNDIIVLLTDAEELGLLGARAFVDQHPWMPEVDLVLSFEMRGGGGPSIMFETNERNGWVVRGLQDFDPHPFANSMSYEVYERLPRDTDFTPFREAGVQGLNFAAIDNAHVYHQVYDTPANLSEATLQHHGIRALEGLRYFANADLTSVNDSNVVFFSVPVLGLIVYDRLWVLGISALLVALFALVFLTARRADARTSRIALGFLVSLAATAAAYFLAGWSFASLTPLHSEYGALQGS